MCHSSTNVFFLFTVMTGLSLGAGGCVAYSGNEDLSGVEESPETLADADEAASAYTSSTDCTVSGGGTWGAILRTCVSISASGTGTFTISKADGSNFSTAGTMYLKVGTYEPWGVDNASKTISGGGIIHGFSFSELFGQWPGYPKEYYARWESQPGGYAWVGPITIYH